MVIISNTAKLVCLQKAVGPSDIDFLDADFSV